MLALRDRYGARLTSACRSTITIPRCMSRSVGGEAGRRRLTAWSGWRATASVSMSPAAASPGSPKQPLRDGFARLFAGHGIPVDAHDPVRLMLFPEMEPHRDVPEITTACWGILHKSPDDVMCSGARMVVKRSDAAAPVVLACTLLAYDPRFEMGGNPGRGVAAGVAEPPVLRLVLRAGWRVLQPLRRRRPNGIDARAA